MNMLHEVWKKREEMKQKVKISGRDTMNPVCKCDAKERESPVTCCDRDTLSRYMHIP